MNQRALICRILYGCTQVQELVVADQKQSRVSFGLSNRVMNAAAMRPIAATLKERGPISVVLPLARNFELTISFPKVGVTVAVGALCVAEINATGENWCSGPVTDVFLSCDYWAGGSDDAGRG
jgi:hypothetical protein